MCYNIISNLFSVFLTVGKLLHSKHISIIFNVLKSFIKFQRELSRNLEEKILSTSTPFESKLTALHKKNCVWGLYFQKLRSYWVWKISRYFQFFRKNKKSISACLNFNQVFNVNIERATKAECMKLHTILKNI